MKELQFIKTTKEEATARTREWGSCYKTLNRFIDGDDDAVKIAWKVEGYVSGASLCNALKKARGKMRHARTIGISINGEFVYLFKN